MVFECFGIDGNDGVFVNGEEQSLMFFEVDGGTQKEESKAIVVFYVFEFFQAEVVDEMEDF